MKAIFLIISVMFLSSCSYHIMKDDKYYHYLSLASEIGYIRGQVDAIYIKGGKSIECYNVEEGKEYCRWIYDSLDFDPVIPLGYITVESAPILHEEIYGK